MRIKRFTRKGMSELLAIVIGVMITIGIGVALYTILPRMITTSAQSNRVAIEVYGTTASDNVAVITITLKNLGQKEIKNVTLSHVEIDGVSVTPTVIANPTLPLSPGEETSMVIQVNNAAVKPGAKIVVVLKIDDIVAHGTGIIAP